MEVGKHELCRILDIVPSTLDSWVNRYGCPCVSRPSGTATSRRGRGAEGQQWKFNVRAVVNWMIQREVTEVVGTVNATAQQDEDHAQRLLRAKADAEEVKLAASLGQYASIDDFRTSLSGVIASAKSKLRGVGPKLAQILATESDPSMCSSLVQRDIDAILAELAATQLSVDPFGRLRIQSNFGIEMSEEEWRKKAEEEGLAVVTPTAVEESSGDTGDTGVEDGLNDPPTFPSDASDIIKSIGDALGKTRRPADRRRS